MNEKVSNLVNHLQHIGIPVTNLVVTEDFYKRLGFESVMRSPFREGDEFGNCLMMRNKQIILEFYQLPDSKLNEIKERKDGHIDHITFDVTDIDVAFTSLKEASFKILEVAPVFLPFWQNGCKYFNIMGPDGERLEFNQILW